MSGSKVIVGLAEAIERAANINMQAKPLTITISAETGRDNVEGAIYPLIESLLDANPHLTLHKVEPETRGDITEINAWLRVSKEADQ